MDGKVPVRGVSGACGGATHGHIVSVTDDTSLVLTCHAGIQYFGQLLEARLGLGVDCGTAQGEGQVAAELDHTQLRVVSDQVGVGFSQIDQCSYPVQAPAPDWS